MDIRKLFFKLFAPKPQFIQADSMNYYHRLRRIQDRDDDIPESSCSRPVKMALVSPAEPSKRFYISTGTKIYETSRRHYV
jgi:hypothetical protein